MNEKSARQVKSSQGTSRHVTSRQIKSSQGEEQKLVSKSSQLVESSNVGESVTVIDSWNVENDCMVPITTIARKLDPLDTTITAPFTSHRWLAFLFGDFFSLIQGTVGTVKSSPTS